MCSFPPALKPRDQSCLVGIRTAQFEPFQDLPRSHLYTSGLQVLQGSEVSENEETKNGPTEGLVVFLFGGDRCETRQM